MATWPVSECRTTSIPSNNKIFAQPRFMADMYIPSANAKKLFPPQMCLALAQWVDHTWSAGTGP